jgi:hypothetical protein
MKDKGFAKKQRLNYEIKCFCETVEILPWNENVLPRDRGLAMKLKSFAKWDKFNQ